MTDIRLYGDGRCHKSRLYVDALNERRVTYTFLDIAKDPEAAQELRTLFSDGQLKIPTFVIAEKIIRNPALYELDRILARRGIYEPGIVHEPQGSRFVRYMLPRDAFVSYSRTGDHIA